ncbi:hypothetical protein Aros01_01283 [Streptosporangium roseum]|uniref:Cell wall-associated hydrolase (Invasion-associated protein)-like protein n=1 Tax=Streptosporangium roseum (strain ATCC 12428 / DSM 43021 / JCM 3005 / KCTC 9067 / NCIMB 10171 / NRRL 2505 / NI 9100) TaxID=479432 RepID=D2AQL0_STRRD|nr:Cell wall-associated hydrolase (invasion- associated protein)-like protein [Streptosporangium roseum DSM 43021]
MITTVFVATVLAAALAGGPQASPARPCPQAVDDWRRPLPEAELPDGARRRFEAGVRLVLAAACGLSRTGPEFPPRAARGDAEDTLSGRGVPRPPDATVSAPGSPDAVGSSGSGGPESPGAAGFPGSGSPDGTGPSGPGSSDAAVSLASGSSGAPRSAGSGPSGLAGSSGPGSPSRVRQPAVVSSARPEASRSLSAPARQSRLPSPGQTAVAAALRQVGRPYVWGGGSSAGPTGGGFDCSGLALHAWSRAGAALTHYTGSQFRQGRRVPFSQLRPGDLVFFGGGTGDPTHVGVYVKNGVMVHAPKTGDVVKTTDFAASAYYRSRYRGAVRPAPRTPAS